METNNPTCPTCGGKLVSVEGLYLLCDPCWKFYNDDLTLSNDETTHCQECGYALVSEERVYEDGETMREFSQYETYCKKCGWSYTWSIGDCNE